MELFDSGIEFLMQSGEKYLFSGFKERDSALKKIKMLWRVQSREVNHSDSEQSEDNYETSKQEDTKS